MSAAQTVENQRLQDEKERLSAEWDDIRKEKERWELEKRRVEAIQPLGEILKLSVSGSEYEVRKSTLCHV